MSAPSLLPPQEEGKPYGFFGYDSEMCLRAMKTDNPEMLVEIIERGVIDKKAEMMTGESILAHCDRIGSTKCADLLRARGWE